jgi:predicted metal-dependent hydrolase
LEQGILKLDFVKFVGNESDIFTKNGIEIFNESFVKFEEYIKEYIKDYIKEYIKEYIKDYIKEYSNEYSD